MRGNERPRPAGFGMPGSVSPETLAALPRAMQAEGVLLLAEMGYGDLERASGLARGTIDHLFSGNVPPFRHGTEHLASRTDAGGEE